MVYCSLVRNLSFSDSGLDWNVCKYSSSLINNLIGLHQGAATSSHYMHLKVPICQL